MKSHLDGRKSELYEGTQLKIFLNRMEMSSAVDVDFVNASRKSCGSKWKFIVLR